MLSLDERTGGLSVAISAATDALSARLHAAIPGIVRSFDPDEQTVTVQPALREQVTIEGASEAKDLPLLVDVPVVMPRAGGYMLAFAPRPGDECLVVFSDLCIDAWWQSGGVQNMFTLRRHDLSDGFAILGVWSQPNRPKLPEGGVCLQNDRGTAGVHIREDTVNLFGAVTVNGAPISMEGRNE